jgi:hypothetical protein
VKNRAAPSAIFFQNPKAILRHEMERGNSIIFDLPRQRDTIMRRQQRD